MDSLAPTLGDGDDGGPYCCSNVVVAVVGSGPCLTVIIIVDMSVRPDV